MTRIKFALAGIALLAATDAASGPFDQFKGRIKEGQYETKMTMEMPGMPAGMGKQNMTHSHCLTKDDIENGRMGRRDGKPSDCEVKDFSMTGSTATYKTVCKGERPVTAESKVTFNDGGYVMDMKMLMNQRGQEMTVNQHMESRYVGPCAAK